MIFNLDVAEEDDENKDKKRPDLPPDQLHVVSDCTQQRIEGIAYGPFETI